MSYTQAEQSRVYLACRPIFAGSNAQIRKHKKILQLLAAHKAPLNVLLNDLGMHRVASIVQALLAKKIFQRESQAKEEFPELFVSSVISDERRATSEKNAASSIAVALDQAVSQEEEESIGTSEDIANHSKLDLIEDADHETGLTQPAVEDDLPTLYPSYLPYSAQHRPLTTVQALLEECCFDFVSEWLPSILEKHGWRCAAAVELTRWTRILSKHASELPAEALHLSQSEPALCEIFSAVRKLRHTAVHRLPITARSVCQLVQSAQHLAAAVRHPQISAQLEQLHKEVQTQVEALELNKNVLEGSLCNNIEEIQRQREELDRKEKDLAARMVREDHYYSSLIGNRIEQSIIELLESQDALDVEQWHDTETGEDEAEL